MFSTRLARCLQACLFLFLWANCGDASPPEAAPEPPPANTSRALEETPARPRFVPGRVIVKFLPLGKERAAVTTLSLQGQTFQKADALPQGAELWTLVTEAGQKSLSVLQQEQATTAAVEALRQRPDVEYAHVDLYLDYFTAPVDEHYALQWHYPAIQLPLAWQTVTGNVSIAVLDSGRVEHPDMSGRWGLGHDFGYETVGVSDPDPTTDGRYHHGLHVAGILGAKWDTTGVAGICRDCPILPVKISSTDNRPILSNVSKAIEWSVNQGARVINMSFGTLEPYAEPCSDFPLIQAAITHAITSGVVVVAAAGNDNRDPSVVTPASCEGVIAVAATQRNGQRAPYSNHGALVALAAPGGGPEAFGDGLGCHDPNGLTPYNGTGGAVSTWAISKTGTQLSGSDYCYRYLSGTSMAAPHVAGVAALILSQRPQWSVAQVKERLLQSASPVPGCTASQCGAGLLDASKAIISPLRVTPPTCNVDGTSATFSCTIAPATGGVAPVQHTWTALANATITSSTGTSAQGTCTRGTEARLSFMAVDAENTGMGYEPHLRCPPPLLDAAFANQQVPTALPPESTYSVSVTMTNTGAETWTAAGGFKLAAVAPEGNTLFWGASRVELSAADSIAPGQSKVFMFNINSPFELGTRPFQWRMMKEGHGLFGAPSPRTDIAVWAQTWNATFVRQTVPESVPMGRPFEVSITMRNTGTETWTPASYARLGSQNPENNTTWGAAALNLPIGASVPRGQEYTFTATLTAPGTPGLYNFRWRMRSLNTTTFEWFGFGGFTENLPITVTLPPRDSAFVSQSGPAMVMVGTSFVYNVTMKNTGTQTWRASDGITLYSGSSAWNFVRGSLAPGEEVAPGQQKTFAVTVTPANMPGPQIMRWRMWHNATGPFGQQSPDATLQVLPQAKATFVRQTVPAFVTPGQSFPVTLTLKNSGDATWGGTPGYQLTPVPALPGHNWGHTSVSMEPGEQVAPGAEKTFSFTAVAPMTQGPHAFQWRMRVQVSPGTFIDFGDASTRVDLLVAGPCYCPPGEVCPDVVCNPDS
ncbi:S8 family serine peptidase [Myxococcus landrumensis]|uniref:S8 family serine peptidase n=1 Tax=Myxococcus landrumensis TaxID=2813577 RepID=A0ABX7N8X7_9BACT|nr:S8 family serine peptidase [Myxococcus landrumus]QSQ13876.1 S8 family serine peptidase [Myxococcus landrumus]